jgi:DNA-binding helix-hairpin-helix protein with protein kinase domain
VAGTERLLQEGSTFELVSSGQRCSVVRFIGEGAEGQVYVATDGTGRELAVKALKPERATATQWNVLRALVDRGAPSDRFLWPRDLTRLGSTFGYTMALRPASFQPVSDWVANRVEPTMRTLLTAGLYLAESFRDLHTSGLCYRDINFGNLFVDFGDGDVVICDCDNVAVNDLAPKNVYGSDLFMAPEIVRGRASGQEVWPNINTDRYSLAVMLFYLFLRSHPLAGLRERATKLLGQAAQTQLYGTDPLFVFDPEDPSNRPSATSPATALWPIYPPWFQQLFVRAFTEGLRDPDRRMVETSWIGAMIRLRDAIGYCACGAEHLFDAPDDAASPVTAGRCWSCQAVVQPPPQLRLKRRPSGRATILLPVGAKLYPHHLAFGRTLDFTTPLAEVVTHPDNADWSGLQNLTDEPWRVWSSAGREGVLEPGRRWLLKDGVRLLFDAGEATVTWQGPA